jgi:hypothetical protein
MEWAVHSDEKHVSMTRASWCVWHSHRKVSGTRVSGTKGCSLAIGARQHGHRAAVWFISAARQQCCAMHLSAGSSPLHLLLRSATGLDPRGVCEGWLRDYSYRRSYARTGWSAHAPAAAGRWRIAAAHQRRPSACRRRAVCLRHTGVAADSFAQRPPAMCPTAEKVGVSRAVAIECATRLRGRPGLGCVHEGAGQVAAICT